MPSTMAIKTRGKKREQKAAPSASVTACIARSSRSMASAQTRGSPAAASTAPKKQTRGAGKTVPTRSADNRKVAAAAAAAVACPVRSHPRALPERHRAVTSRQAKPAACEAAIAYSEDDAETGQPIATAVAKPVAAAPAKYPTAVTNDDGEHEETDDEYEQPEINEADYYDYEEPLDRAEEEDITDEDAEDEEDDDDSDFPYEDANGVWRDPHPDRNCTLDFGMYSDRTYKDVFREDYAYVEWCRQCDDPCPEMVDFLEFCETMDRRRPKFEISVHVRIMGPLTSRRGFALDDDLGSSAPNSDESCDEDDVSDQGMGFQGYSSDDEWY